MVVDFQGQALAVLLKGIHSSDANNKISKVIVDLTYDQILVNMMKSEWMSLYVAHAVPYVSSVDK